MNKRTITAIIVIAIIILIGIFGFVYKKKKKNNDNTQIIEETIIDEQVNNIDNKTIEFLKSVHGLKIENVELINNPVGFDEYF